MSVIRQAFVGDNPARTLNPNPQNLLLPGSASRGLYRVHQFSKVEMFVVCTPEQSEALLEDLADLEKEMFIELGLHFKILVCIL